MKQSVKIVIITSSIIVILGLGIFLGVYFGLIYNQDRKYDWTYDSEKLNEFFLKKAELKNSSTDSVALAMAQYADDWINVNDSIYASTLQFDKPVIKYWSVEYFERKSESFYLIWLPTNWQSQPIKKAFIYLQGHGTSYPKMLSVQHELAKARDMAIFMPQLWLETENVPEGYNPWEKLPEDIQSGLPDGYHLDSKDIHLFINAIIDEFNIESICLHGFSLSAAHTLILSAYDKLTNNIIDYSFFNAGHIGYDHPLVEEMDEIGETDYLLDENFFLFTELDPGETIAERKAAMVHDEIMIAAGANITQEIYLQVGHGELFYNYPVLCNQGLNDYFYFVIDRFN
jgi:hypothetical protein